MLYYVTIQGGIHMEKYNKAVNNVYKRINDCVILGLTGRTGSGCTTTAHILETSDFYRLNLPSPKKSQFLNTEERKYAIVYNFAKKNWKPFITFEVSSIILSFVFEKRFEDFIKYLDELCEGSETRNFHISGYTELKSKLNGIHDFFEDKHFVKLSQNPESDDTYNEIKEYCETTLKKRKASLYELLSEYSCYESTKSKFKKSKEKKSQLYTFLMQSFGNNIRSSGNPFENNFDENHFTEIAKRIGKIVDCIINKEKDTKICIDAIRNPYEAYCFKDKYKQFYLVSVSTNDIDRRTRLKKFNEEQLLSLDNMEYPVDFTDGKIFYQQSIAECLQIADIHLYNPNSNLLQHEILTKNLIRYICLMLHPGLVTPTHIERCMQMAFTAKLNSGCLSRQVGAVITDKDYYIKSIGWNDVPQGQVSCNLRTIQNYFSEHDTDTYSEFELENKQFREAMRYLSEDYSKWLKHCKSFYNTPICFKDMYNGIKRDKNQVFTRSLHAEENAFLQISKFGGQGIKGGKLFVTASPCELCSKKSYQLGIEDIYYIDPYPGIASTHVLKGSSKNNPKLHLFYGAIGNAYFALYMQRFAIKDELQFVSGINIKNKISNQNNSNTSVFHDNIEYKYYEINLVFRTRTQIEFLQKATLSPLTEELTEIPKNISWTGSSYIKTTNEKKGDDYSIIEQNKGNGNYRIILCPKNKISKNEDFTYKICTSVSDENEIMNPILSHHVNAKIKNLKLKVSFNKKFFKDKQPSAFKLKQYADIDKNIIYDEQPLECTEEGDNYSWSREFDDPILLYTYSIEWDF